MIWCALQPYFQAARSGESAIVQTFPLSSAHGAPVNISQNTDKGDLIRCQIRFCAGFAAHDPNHFPFVAQGDINTRKYHTPANIQVKLGVIGLLRASLAIMVRLFQGRQK